MPSCPGRLTAGPRHADAREAGQASALLGPAASGGKRNIRVRRPELGPPGRELRVLVRFRGPPNSGRLPIQELSVVVGVLVPE